MTVKEFIDEYSKAAKPEVFIKKHIITDYVPYAKKITLCNAIVDNSMYMKIDDKKIYRRNMPVHYMLFTLTLIKEYTDIEIDFGNTDEFDLLEQTGLGDIIKASIPEKEFNSFSTILTMCVDDDYENNRSIQSYLDGFKIYLETINNLVEKNIEGE